MSVGQTSTAKAAEKRLPSQAAARGRTYVYAVITDAQGRTYGDFGIDGRKVYSIPVGRVAAVVSDLSSEKIRPERSRLAAHQEVLKKLMAETTPLPMAFGILAENPEAVRKMLSRNQRALLVQLHRVAGRVEMGLRVTWDVPNIFEYFVNTHPELRLARDRFLGGHREATQEQKIEVGRMFDRLLNEDRDEYTDNVEEILAPHCTEIERNKCRNERELMNLACLVERAAMPQFEGGVFEAAQQFDNNFAFDYNGPWAPHNFVDIDLEL
ncbi:MAG: GvpL/GvpF family gas vesicle protein [Acidobacteriia bacterium]|nr:GvpL/GvpF family gas vesicle protein [Terriglobia bacterium]